MKNAIRVAARIARSVLILAAVAKTFGMSYFHLLPLLVGVGSNILTKKAPQRPERRTRTVSIVLAAMFSVFTVFANYSNIFRPMMLDTWLLIALCLAGLFLLYWMLLEWLYGRVGKCSLNEKSPPKRTWPLFLISFGATLLCWLPYYLAFFPGISNDDSNWQIRQLLGIEPLSNHHPIAHTMLLKLLVQSGLKLDGTLMTAVAWTSGLQMICVALVFAYTVYRIRKNGIHSAFCVIAAALFAILPYHAMYAITLWKDTWFGVLFLLFSVTLWTVLIQDKAKKAAYYIQCAVLFLSGVGVCLFRTNGFYLMIVALPFAVWAFFKKDKPALAACVVAVAVSAVVLGPVYNKISAKPVDPIEFLSVPVQQISRVITDNGQISAEDVALLNEIVDFDRIPSAYYNRISDNIKNLVREKDNQQFLLDHKGEYLSLWLRLGVRNPLHYIVAYTDGTYGFWYPDVSYWTFLVATETNDLGLANTSKLNAPIIGLPTIWWLENAHKVPVLNLLYSCGAIAWMVLILFGAAMIAKDRKKFMILLPGVLLWLTTIVTTPVFSQLRYIYALAVVLPVYFAVIFNKEEQKEKIT